MPRTTRQEFQHQMDQARVNLEHYIAHMSKCLAMMADVAQQATRGEIEWNDSYQRQGDEYAACVEMAQNLRDAHDFIRKDF